eukprot:1660013-Pleurochrysis_carterae.AAC.1
MSATTTPCQGSSVVLGAQRCVGGRSAFAQAARLRILEKELRLRSRGENAQQLRIYVKTRSRAHSAERQQSLGTRRRHRLWPGQKGAAMLSMRAFGTQFDEGRACQLEVKASAAMYATSSAMPTS